MGRTARSGRSWQSVRSASRSRPRCSPTSPAPPVLAAVPQVVLRPCPRRWRRGCRRGRRPGSPAELPAGSAAELPPELSAEAQPGAGGAGGVHLSAAGGGTGRGTAAAPGRMRDGEHCLDRADRPAGAAGAVPAAAAPVTWPGGAVRPGRRRGRDRARRAGRPALVVDRPEGRADPDRIRPLSDRGRARGLLRRRRLVHDHWWGHRNS